MLSGVEREAGFGGKDHVKLADQRVRPQPGKQLEEVLSVSAAQATRREVEYEHPHGRVPDTKARPRWLPGDRRRGRSWNPMSEAMKEDGRRWPFRGGPVGERRRYIPMGLNSCSASAAFAMFFLDATDPTIDSRFAAR